MIFARVVSSIEGILTGWINPEYMISGIRYTDLLCERMGVDDMDFWYASGLVVSLSVCRRVEVVEVLAFLLGEDIQGGRSSVSS